jgi:hypothetical protein
MTEVLKEVSEIRFSLFAEKPITESPTQLFQEFFQHAPQVMINKLQDLMAEVSASVGDTKYVLESTSAKLDFKIQPVIDVNSDTFTSKIPTVNANWTNEKVLECAKRIIDKIPATRLAIGHKYLLQLDSREACYDKLNELINGLNIDAKASDFLYRINRRKQFTVNKDVQIQLNRIGQWSCLEVDLRAINNVTKMVELSKDMFAVSLDTDINSAPENSNLVSKITVEERYKLFDEILKQSAELALKGDEP